MPPIHREYAYERTFNALDLAQSPWPPHTFENCVFKHCHFSNADLSHFQFMDTTFVECDFSNAVLDQSSWQAVQLEKCKMLGLAFEHCNDFGFAIHATASRFDHASFYGMSLNRCAFIHSQMHHVDFSEAQMPNVSLKGSDFLGATFDNTDLQKADLRGAIHYTIHPMRNRVKGLQVDWPSAGGLLSDFGLSIT